MKLILKNVEKPENNVVKLEISVEKQDFEENIEKAYKKNAHRFNVQGFRRGKAPRRMIERMYGENVFYEDAVNLAYPDAYSSAVKEAGIEPVDRAEVELVDIDENGFTFNATVTVKPAAAIGKYKGVEAVKETVEVTDGDVEEELARRRDRAGRLESADRPAKSGDTVVIDFEGFVDGVAFEGGKAENHSLKLGSGQFIPGFEDALAGASAGDEKDVDVAFPEDYHAEELKGKPALFKVKVSEVKENVLPELDDEFAKDVSEFETLDELKSDIKEKLTESRQKTADGDFEAKLLDAVLEDMQVEIPEVMVEHQLDHVAEDFEYRLRAQGLTLDTYLQISGMDGESFRKTFRDQAERQVKIGLALEAVVAAEGLALSEEELDAEYASMAELYKTPLEDVKKYFEKDTISKELLSKKAMDLIKESAVEKAPAPAKKPKKKKADEPVEAEAEAKDDASEE